MTFPSSTRVLITDGLWRKSLSAVRSLGKAGAHVTVMGNTSFTPCFWSRFTRQRILAPLAADDAPGFGRILLKTLEQSPELVLFPMEDPTLTWVAQNQRALSPFHCRFLIPSLSSLAIAQDKALTLAEARKIQIACPQTWVPQTIHEFISQLETLSPDQYIVKPRSSSGSWGFSYLGQKTRADWENHWETFGPMLIQERIPSHGSAYGVSLLMDQDGECVASFVHKRRHQLPLSGGPSTDRQSVHNPELVEMSIRLLKHLGWRGIAMIEWKTDPRDQKHKLMEINPRFWGSLELAVRAGVDFPTLYAQAALGEKLGPPPTYRAGVRCRWLIPGEFLRYLAQSQMERESLWRFLRGLPTCAEEWDVHDLDGFFSTLICTGAQLFNPDYWETIKTE